LHLTGKELDTRRPYPNKEYAVACRRQGRKAIDGILIETAKFIGRFDIKTQWAVEALLLVTHCVDYRVIDRDFPAASDDMMLWEKFSIWDLDQQKEIAITSSRMPERPRPGGTMRLAPLMELVPPLLKPSCDDSTDDLGLILARRERFEMPTIEPERLADPRLSPFRIDRKPPLNSAFKTGL
jgi:hypothetical protein